MQQSISPLWEIFDLEGLRGLTWSSTGSCTPSWNDTSRYPVCAARHHHVNLTVLPHDAPTVIGLQIELSGDD